MKRSPETAAAFCALIARDGNVLAAAKTLGVHIASLYRWRAADAHFALDWELALRSYRERRVARLMAQAEHQGQPAPTRSKGPRRRKLRPSEKRPARR